MEHIDAKMIEIQFDYELDFFILSHILILYLKEMIFIFLTFFRSWMSVHVLFFQFFS